MADPHVTTEPAPADANPGIAYEHRDIDPKKVFWAGVAFAGLCLVGAGVALAMFLGLHWREDNRPDKVPALPEAAVDQREEAFPPIPLEGVVDVKNRDVQLWPDRQKRGVGGKDHVPISQVLDELPGKLKARKEAPPASYLRRLPSKASSGRTETGGQ
jgi:hypothetical protein